MAAHVMQDTKNYILLQDAYQHPKIFIMSTSHIIQHFLKNYLNKIGEEKRKNNKKVQKVRKRLHVELFYSPFLHAWQLY